MQDGLLLASVMLVATLLALQYDLFWFVSKLSEPQRRISLVEAIFLTILLGFCLFAFVIRRLREERRHIARRATAKHQVRELKRMASQDSLTGLANRRALLGALTAATAAPHSDGRQHALFLMDLNDFKHVNDVHGHGIGDAVLKVITERFRAVTRPSDLLARLGGDEFAVISYDVDREAANAIGLRFIEALEYEIRVGGHSHKVGASVGAALIPGDGISAEEVLHSADLAMYRAKGRGQSCLVFFEPDASLPKRIA